MLRLFARCGLLPLLTFLQPQRNQVSWTDYYNLKCDRVKRVESPDGRSKKVLVLSFEKDSITIESAIRDFQIIDNPTGQVLDSMKRAYALTTDSGNEHGFFVGRRGTITPIEEGTPFGMPNDVLNRGKDYLKHRDDTSAYDVHTHEKYPPGKPGEYGNAKPSGGADGDSRPGNFINRTQASVILGYEQVAHHDLGPGSKGEVDKVYPPELIQSIGFYYKDKYFRQLEFKRFIYIANEINKIK